MKLAQFGREVVKRQGEVFKGNTYADALIDVRRLSKRFGRSGRVQALNDVSFSVEKGATLGLVGADGAGKTTLFRILATLLRPNEGSAGIGGFDVVLARDEVREIIGYVPQTPALNRNMSLLNYLNVWGMIEGLPGGQRKDRIEELLQFLELGGATSEMVFDCTTYVCQRMWLAQALLSDPKVLLLDEPLAGLTPSEGDHYSEKLETLKEEGKTILLSSSQLQDVTSVCSHIVAISDGRATEVYETSALLKAVGEALHARVFVEAKALPSRVLSTLKDLSGVIDVTQTVTATVIYVEPGRVELEEIERVLREKNVEDYTIKVGEIALSEVFRTLSDGG